MIIQYPNAELLKISQSSKSFSKYMKQNDIFYQQKLQQAYYTDLLSKVSKQFIQIICQNVLNNNQKNKKEQKKKIKLIFIFSIFQTIEHKNSNQQVQFYRLYMRFINEFHKPEQPFYLIYVNSVTQKSKTQSWSIFKTHILQRLPLQYFLYLKNIIIIRPSFLDKASSFITFDTLSKFINDKCIYFDNLEQFIKEKGLNSKQFSNRLPKAVNEQENLCKQVKSIMPLICSPNLRRDSYQNQQLPTLLSMKSDPSNIKMNIKPNTIKKLKFNKSISNYPIGQVGIPLVFDALIFYFTSQPKRCLTQGIFRKASSIDDDQELLQQLQKQNYDILQNYSQNIVVASVIKKIFTSLEQPIITYQIHKNILQKHDIQTLKKEIESLPMINFITLMHFLKFLKDYIITHERENKMSLNNIAICIAPCIMRFKDINPANQFKYAGIHVNITKILIQKFDEIFGNKQKQNKIYNKSIKIFRQNSIKNEDTNFLDNQKVQKRKDIIYKIDKKQEQNRNMKQFNCFEEYLMPAINILTPKVKQDTSEGYSQHNEFQSQKFFKDQNAPSTNSNRKGSQIIEQQEKNASNLLQINSSIRKKHKSWYNLSTLDQQERKKQIADNSKQIAENSKKTNNNLYNSSKSNAGDIKQQVKIYEEQSPRIIQRVKSSTRVRIAFKNLNKQ